MRESIVIIIIGGKHWFRQVDCRHGAHWRRNVCKSRVGVDVSKSGCTTESATAHPPTININNTPTKMMIVNKRSFAFFRAFASEVAFARRHFALVVVLRGGSEWSQATFLQRFLGHAVHVPRLCVAAYGRGTGGIHIDHSRLAPPCCCCCCCWCTALLVSRCGVERRGGGRRTVRRSLGLFALAFNYTARWDAPHTTSSTYSHLLSLWLHARAPRLSFVSFLLNHPIVLVFF